jgi:DNA-binding MarR family transcriptional regulator
VLEVDVRDIALLLRGAQLRKAAACDAALSPLGANLSQWGVLRAVAAVPDASAHSLAVQTSQSDQSLGGVVAGLVSRGLIERRQGPGRAIRHRLTPQGSELLDRCENVVAEAMAQYLEPLTATERVLLQDLLRRLARPDQPGRPFDVPVE